MTPVCVHPASAVAFAVAAACVLPGSRVLASQSRNQRIWKMTATRRRNTKDQYVCFLRAARRRSARGACGVCRALARVVRARAPTGRALACVVAPFRRGCCPDRVTCSPLTDAFAATAFAFFARAQVHQNDGRLRAPGNPVPHQRACFLAGCLAFVPNATRCLAEGGARRVPLAGNPGLSPRALAGAVAAGPCRCCRRGPLQVLPANRACAARVCPRRARDFLRGSSTG